MANRLSQPFWAGFLCGAGLALFALYVLAQAVAINLEGWPRIPVGAVGLGLLVVGFGLGRRLDKAPGRTDAVQGLGPKT